jgi:hypothetical protein
MLNQFSSTVRAHEAQRFDHATDDFGYPICACAPCRERSERMNTDFILRLTAIGRDPERVIEQPNDQHEFDYDGDGGREYDDYLRDNNPRIGCSFGDWKKIGDVLPVIEAPSIVPEQPTADERKRNGERHQDEAPREADT